MESFAFIGFGELASALTTGLKDAGVSDIRVYVRHRPHENGITRRIAAAGAVKAESLNEALSGADVVIAAVPAAAAHDVAATSAPLLDRDALYVDPAPAPPSEKAEAAELITAKGARYVDAAVIGTTVTDGCRVPFLACGPGARRWAELGAKLGLNVRAVDGPPGHASLVKLLRSVYLKGRDALILEMLLAARRYGVEAEVIASVDGSGEHVPFPALAERVITALAIHSERRAAELRASAEVLERAQVEPAVTGGAVERLAKLGEIDLRRFFDGVRPEAAADVFAAIDEAVDPEGWL